MDKDEIPEVERLQYPVYIASAVYAGYSHIEAMRKISAGISEPALGVLDPRKVQLCPQNPSTLSEEACAELVEEFPSTHFRVHANTSCGGCFGLHDASSDWGSSAFSTWKSMLASACSTLGAEAYTWHAGRSASATLGQAIARTLDLEQELGLPVGIEGLYPSKVTPWLMSTFEDYREVMESGAGFVVDLSHWQIISREVGRQDLGLLKELLTHPRCLEIHLSDNDERRDSHRKLERKPYWFSLLCQLQAQGRIVADVFSEGLQESKRSSIAAGARKIY